MMLAIILELLSQAIRKTRPGNLPNPRLPFCHQRFSKSRLLQTKRTDLQTRNYRKNQLEPHNKTGSSPDYK